MCQSLLLLLVHFVYLSSSTGFCGKHQAIQVPPKCFWVSFVKFFLQCAHIITNSVLRCKGYYATSPPETQNVFNETHPYSVYSKTKQLFALYIFIWHERRQTDYTQLYNAIIFCFLSCVGRLQTLLTYRWRKF